LIVNSKKETPAVCTICVRYSYCEQYSHQYWKHCVPLWLCCLQ